MNPKHSVCQYLGILVLFLLFASSQIVSAQEVVNGAQALDDANPVLTQVLDQTELDLPGQFHEEFGMLPDSKLAKSLRRLSKVDMDGDMNYDGRIDNDDSSDQGARESDPPGLQVGVGEMTKLIVRFKTYDNEYPGEVFVKLNIDGINRMSRSGKYATDEERTESIGRLRVWAESEKKTLLLDSADPEKLEVEWKVDKKDLKSGVPGLIPRTLFVEGVEISKKFEGDLRLLVSASHTLSEGEIREPSSIYHTAYDHIVFTVRENPVVKGFTSDNVDGVWSQAKNGGQASSSQ